MNVCTAGQVAVHAGWRCASVLAVAAAAQAQHDAHVQKRSPQSSTASSTGSTRAQAHMPRTIIDQMAAMPHNLLDQLPVDQAVDLHCDAAGQPGVHVGCPLHASSPSVRCAHGRAHRRCCTHRVRCTHRCISKWMLPPIAHRRATPPEGAQASGSAAAAGAPDARTPGPSVRSTTDDQHRVPFKRPIRNHVATGLLEFVLQRDRLSKRALIFSTSILLPGTPASTSASTRSANCCPYNVCSIASTLALAAAR